MIQKVLALKMRISPGWESQPSWVVENATFAIKIYIFVYFPVRNSYKSAIKVTILGYFDILTRRIVNILRHLRLVEFLL